MCVVYPKYSDRQALANSVDPDQTAPKGAKSSLTGSLFASDPTPYRK